MLYGLDSQDIQRLRDVLAHVERHQREAPDGRPDRGFVPGVLRMAKVVKCGNGGASGYGEIQFYTGDPHDRALDTSLTVKCSVSKWFQKGQDVWVAPAACVSISWAVVAAIIGPTFFEPPTAGELASPQDNPAATTTCTDSVAVP